MKSCHSPSDIQRKMKSKRVNKVHEVHVRNSPNETGGDRHVQAETHDRGYVTAKLMNIPGLALAEGQNGDNRGGVEALSF
jgi:hypothetical protein